jgi:hypothetical protein
MSTPKKLTSKITSTATKKKAIVKKEISHKKVAPKKKVAVKTAAAKKKIMAKPPAGYSETDSGLVVPTDLSQPIPATKLRAGFNKAKTEINSLIKEIASTMTESYSISEIELTASFSADGKFMGFGVGGAASIKIKITPEN